MVSEHHGARQACSRPRRANRELEGPTRTPARRGFGSWPGVGGSALGAGFAFGVRRGAGGEGEGHDDAVVEAGRGVVLVRQRMRTLDFLVNPPGESFNGWAYPVDKPVMKLQKSPTDEVS